MSHTLPYCLPDDITPEQFLAEYWQKKPLLIKQGLPQLAEWFTPEDILELALDEAASSRLLTERPMTTETSNPSGLTQSDSDQPMQWTLKQSPLQESDFEQLPPQWSVLVQNMEQWSPELGQLWEAFGFIPQWQRDDIMVSYAPKGGSVGKHYDEYDVFLAQGYGRKRWQLGQYCDDTTAFIPDQPIRIFDEMGVLIFDEVLSPGDVLYVPPKLSHYGVAQDDCLTFSFGFRRPNLMQVLDSLVDAATTQPSVFKPLLLQQHVQPAGLLTQATVQQIKGELLSLLQSDMGDTLLTEAISETVSRRQYDILLPEDTLDRDSLKQALEQGAVLHPDYSSRLLYTESPATDKTTIDTAETITNTVTDTVTNTVTNTLLFYANGQVLEDITTETRPLLKRLADGESLMADEVASIPLQTLLDWLENGWVWLQA